ncbi:hypothetical protein, partial [Vibrio sp. C8]
INILIISMIEIDVHGNQTHQSGEEPIQVIRKHSQLEQKVANGKVGNCGVFLTAFSVEYEDQKRSL